MDEDRNNFQGMYSQEDIRKRYEKRLEQLQEEYLLQLHHPVSRYQKIIGIFFDLQQLQAG